MKRITMALTLSCALSTTIFAGDIPSTDVTSPLPPSKMEPISVVASRDIPTSEYREELSNSTLTSVLMVLGSIF